MNKILIAVFILFISNLSGFGQNSKKIWRLLGKVEFEKKYQKKLKTHINYPIFTEDIKALDGKIIKIRCYVFPIELENMEEENIKIVSRYRHKSLGINYHEGGTRQEELIEVFFIKNENSEKYFNKQILIKGRLKLNSTDHEKLIYILEDAEIISIEE